MKKIVVVLLLVVCMVVGSTVVQGAGTDLRSTIMGWLGGKGSDYVTKAELADILARYTKQVDEDSRVTSVVANTMGSTVKVHTENSKSISHGTGVFVDSQLILTNYHVVEGDDIFWIETPAGGRYPFTVVATDSVYDLALLKIEGDTTFPYLGFAQTVRAGETAIVIGNPVIEGIQLDWTVTKGIISNPEADGAYDIKSLQIDAAVNNGVSGGPIVNLDGELMGIVCEGSDIQQNLNFGVHKVYIQNFLNEYKSKQLRR
jgi:S1-C subfamily serine protease